MRRIALTALAVLASGVSLQAQSGGAVAGTVRSGGETAGPLEGVRISVDGDRLIVQTDARGLYRVRGLAAGWHSIAAAAIGYRPVTHDSVLVRSGQTTALDFSLTPDPVGLAPIEVYAERVDSVLDPLAIQDQQRFTAEELRRLPVTTVDEAIALSAGAVGESYRGGRLGQQATVLDGLGVKNQLDASTGGLGVRIPPGMLTEASLITNGFSARYGQAVSALVNLVTRDGADRWGGGIAYETDRPMPQKADYGIDRTVLTVEGPLPAGIRFLATADLSAQLDADPVNAPAPTNPLDPRHDEPWLLPHNSGERMDLAGKLTIPLGTGRTLRILGLHSADQRLLYDPAYKYETVFAPAQRSSGNYLNAHLQQAFLGSGILADLRFGWFSREFIRGTPEEIPEYRFGAFTGERIAIMGEDIARRQDTAAASAALPGFAVPTFSDRTPWGVPAFFAGRASRGSLAWNDFQELRGRFDLSIPAGSQGDLYVGAEYVGQDVQTFQRILGYLPAGDSVPSPSVSDFKPWAGAVYAEGQWQADELAFTAGLRYDQFSGRDDLPGQPSKTVRALSPRAAISTVFKDVTFVASIGRFQQPPDYQYLVDAAFDDTTRTGRFRQGNPALGYEEATQYEFSLRFRPSERVSLKTNLYVRRLDGLVASVPLGVDPDSSIFGNADAGTVKGLELIFDREFFQGWGVRLSYTLQNATATASDAFFLRKALRIDPITGDTITPAKVEFPLDYDRRHSFVAILSGAVPQAFGPKIGNASILGGLEGTVVVQAASGLPFSYADPWTDTLIGLPNEGRLPSISTVDLLIRRPLTIGRMAGSLYLDMRNLLNTRNTVAVRRDSGTPGATKAALQEMADSAYAAHPEPIPYESPRYRRWADLDNNGLVDGPAELKPLYLLAAQDFSQPLFAYGPPRLVRLGMEVRF
jgi:outer membrane receptor protein involved in Fe transport